MPIKLERMFEYTIPQDLLPLKQQQDRLQLRSLLPSPSTTSNLIFDIRQDMAEDQLRQELQESIYEACHQSHGDAAAVMPDLVLWDEKGLRYFEDVTYSPDYYLTNEEIAILERQKFDIVRYIENGSLLVELGSGNLRKTKILLDALDELGREVDYFALDISSAELQRTLSVIPPGSFNHVRCFGLFGTYDDVREWLKRPGIAERQKTLLFLGSTLGGFQRDDAAEFLASFGGSIGPSVPGELRPSFLIGLDGCKEQERVFQAYNDVPGVNRRFVRHGLERANEILGHEAFDLDKWDVVGRWDQENGCHNQFYFPKLDVSLQGTTLPAGRRLLAIQSHKYDAKDREALCRKAKLQLIDLWSSPEQYRVCYLSPAG